jgi:hypothetical protein
MVSEVLVLGEQEFPPGSMAKWRDSSAGGDKREQAQAAASRWMLKTAMVSCHDLNC